MKTKSFYLRDCYPALEWGVRKTTLYGKCDCLTMEKPTESDKGKAVLRIVSEEEEMRLQPRSHNDPIDIIYRNAIRYGLYNLSCRLSGKYLPCL